jgi:hypothetical protein
MDKFTAWDVFKQNSIRSKVQNKTCIPSALRDIFVSRLVMENAEACKQGKKPVFSSLIREQWAGQAAQFTSWLAGIIPQLGAWFAASTGLQAASILNWDASQSNAQFDADDMDLFTLASRYAQFLNTNTLFEPAWETPPFNDTETDYYLFFPESLSDYHEYKELLAASNRVKTVSAMETGVQCDAFFYSNSRSEITEAALYISSLHENKGIEWDSIVVSIPNSEYYEPYILREFANRNIPFTKRVGKPLTDYPAGRFFRSAIDCVSQDFAFSAFSGILLNANLPWKEPEKINDLVEFGITNNCICSWTEEKDGKVQKVNVWEDAFARPYHGYDPDTRKFFNALSSRLRSLRSAASFSELRRQYFVFRESFFDMDKCAPETNLILSRCISELLYLTEIEKSFPDFPAPDPFLFFTDYLSGQIYLAQQSSAGVAILPYKTAAQAPFDCHIILGADQDGMSVVFSRLGFLPRSKREKLGIADEDASAAFIGLHKFNSLKTTAFFCSEHTFSGYAIPHSMINAPIKHKERYADTEQREKFNEDYYRLEYLFDGTGQVTLHENQKHGYDAWKSRRGPIANQCGKWKAHNVLLKSIKKQFFDNPHSPNRYSVSASSLEQYFHCSLKWLFNRVLELENVQIEASLMAENISGMAHHAVLDSFFSKLKETKKPLLPPDCSGPSPALPPVYQKLLEQSVTTVFSCFPALKPDGKPEMSALTARLLNAEKNLVCFQLENCLANFLLFFSGCRIKGTEIWYPAEGGDDFCLNGKLDCLLEDCRGGLSAEDNNVIIDFKLKWTPKREDCTGEGEKDLSNFQLPMYVCLVEKNEKIKVNTALFYSILDSKPEVIFGTVMNAQTEELIPKKEDDRIMRESEKFKGIIEEFTRKTVQFADEIKTGNFTVFESDYNECNNCDYHSICRTVYRIGREKFMSAGKYDE